MKNNQVKLTLLCDNHIERSDLLAEHGLSFLIEIGKTNILFDTGQGLTIKHNAKKLNIDLNSVDMIILSHGHYDHTGGLKEVLQNKSEVKIYAHPDIFKPKYKKLKTGKMKYIGYPQVLLKRNRSNFIFNTEPFWISKNILLTGQIPRITSFEKIEEEFYVKSDEGWVKDELLDDQALAINTPSGLILILGCAHSGLINILRYLVKITDKKDFLLVAGGIHLKNASKEKVDRTIEALGEFNIQKFVLSHCTGIPAFIKIYNTLKDKVSLGEVGKTWQIL